MSRGLPLLRHVWPQSLNAWRCIANKVLASRRTMSPHARTFCCQTCAQCRPLVQAQDQLATTLPGDDNIVFENFTSLQLMGSTESQLPVFDGSTNIGCVCCLQNIGLLAMCCLAIAHQHDSQRTCAVTHASAHPIAHVMQRVAMSACHSQELDHPHHECNSGLR